MNTNDSMDVVVPRYELAAELAGHEADVRHASRDSWCKMGSDSRFASSAHRGDGANPDTWTIKRCAGYVQCQELGWPRLRGIARYACGLAQGGPPAASCQGTSTTSPLSSPFLPAGSPLPLHLSLLFLMDESELLRELIFVWVVMVQLATGEGRAGVGWQRWSHQHLGPRLSRGSGHDAGGPREARRRPRCRAQRPSCLWQLVRALLFTPALLPR